MCCTQAQHATQSFGACFTSAPFRMQEANLTKCSLSDNLSAKQVLILKAHRVLVIGAADFAKAFDGDHAAKVRPVLAPPRRCGRRLRCALLDMACLALGRDASVLQRMTSCG